MMDPFKNVRANKMPLNTTFSLSSYIERRESQLAERERNRHDSANFVSAKSQKGTSIIIVNGRRNDLPSSSCSKQITEPSQNISTKNLDIPQKLSHRKRTFSEEVLELSRHQIVLTRTKTVDVSLLPPKRIKSGFFNPTPRHRLSHCRNEGSCEVYDHRQKDEQYKRLMPSPRSSLMPIGCSSHSGIERIPNRNQMCHSFPPFTVTRVFVKTEERSVVSALLGAIFPWDVWGNESIGTKKLHNTLPSEHTLFPIAIVETESYVFIKFTIDEDDSKMNPIHESGIPAVLENSLLLPVKIVSKLVKWILGTE